MAINTEMKFGVRIRCICPLSEDYAPIDRYLDEPVDRHSLVEAMEAIEVWPPPRIKKSN